jgi:hypothetical protein
MSVDAATLEAVGIATYAEAIAADSRSSASLTLK